MTDDNLLPFDLPAVARNKLTVDFDGGALLLLRQAEKRLGVCRRLAVGRCPGTGASRASQSTISRLENAPSRVQAAWRRWRSAGWRGRSGS